MAQYSSEGSPSSEVKGEISSLPKGSENLVEVTPFEAPLPNEPLPTISQPSETPPPLPDEPLPSSQSHPIADEELKESSHFKNAREDEEDEEDVEDDDNDDEPGESSAQGAEPDAWQAVWDPTHQAYYFYNSDTRETTWTNPRLPPEEAAALLAAHPPQAPQYDYSYYTQNGLPLPSNILDPITGESYSQEQQSDNLNPEEEYTFSAHFNRRTGKFRSNPALDPSNYTSDARSDRQMSAFFDTAGYSVGGQSLKEERRGRKLSKKEVEEFRRIRKEKKENRKRAWLQD